MSSLSNHTGHGRDDLLTGLLDRLGGFGEGVQPQLANHTGHKGAVAEARALIRYVFYSTPEDILKPGGVPIGSSGSSANIREVKGDVDDALDLLARLAQAGGGFRDITPSGYPGIMIELNSGGIAAVRDEMSRSPGTNATLDVNNIPNVSEIKKIKFNP